MLATFGAGNAIGVVLGGFLGHFTYKRDVRGPPCVMGISLLLGCIPFYFLINNVDEYASVSCVEVCVPSNQRAYLTTAVL